MKKLMLILMLFSATAIKAETNTLNDVIHTVSNALQTLKAQVGERELELIEGELLCFEMGFNTNAPYRAFTPIITNNWLQIITNINLISTNYVDRLLVFGTGKQGDEILYLRYYETLAGMKIADEISAEDLSSFSASTRADLDTLISRRYSEPVVSNLIEILKLANPDTNYWNYIQSGEAYRKYQAEAQCGMWGPTPPQ